MGDIEGGVSARRNARRDITSDDGVMASPYRAIKIMRKNDNTHLGADSASSSVVVMRAALLYGGRGVASSRSTSGLRSPRSSLFFLVFSIQASQAVTAGF
jgi:hypothetical protein